MKINEAQWNKLNIRGMRSIGQAQVKPEVILQGGLGNLFMSSSQLPAALGRLSSVTIVPTDTSCTSLPFDIETTLSIKPEAFRRCLLYVSKAKYRWLKEVETPKRGRLWTYASSPNYTTRNIVKEMIKSGKTDLEIEFGHGSAFFGPPDVIRALNAMSFIFTLSRKCDVAKALNAMSFIFAFSNKGKDPERYATSLTADDVLRPQHRASIIGKGPEESEDDWEF